MSYLKDYSTRVTPQSEPIPGSDQVPNSAGGHAWAVDDWTRLDRFLILGAEGGTYYVKQRELTIQNAEAVRRCIAADGIRTVQRIVEISQGGRAPKNDPAIFALAMAAGLGDAETRRYALVKLTAVCRIGTHLFHFAEYVQQFRGWGRGLRAAIAGWYTDKRLEDLVYQLIKYRQRDGWSHRDLLRKAHPNSSNDAQNGLFSWVVDGVWPDRTDVDVSPPLLDAFIKAQHATDAAQIAGLIRDYKLPREAIPTEFLASRAVWEALLENMPMTALIRNLPTLTRHGIIAPFSDGLARVVHQLGDAERIRKARVHPLAILAALVTYSAGKSARGDATWLPVPQVIDALDAAFYTSFDNVEPVGESTLLALDVSGSMGWGEVAGVPGITPRVAAAAMALVTAATEPNYAIMAFGNRFHQLPVSPRMRLDDVVKMTTNLPFGGTDCALPMQWALENQADVDLFAVYTDSETWAGRQHPSQALQRYREARGRAAKLAVVGMESNGFSIADPNDAGMLDVVGFDTATPNVISAFARG